jgi:hypothetical protein
MRMSRLRFPAAALAALALAATARAQQPAPGAPDLVLTGGRIFTADSARPWAEALAIRGNRIVAVGADADVARLAGPSTRRIALGGRVVVPGFNDAHYHLVIGSGGVSFATGRSPIPDAPLDVVLDSIAAVAGRTPAGTWITGAVGVAVLDDPRARREALDRVAPDNPVTLTSGPGHGAVFNSAALRALGADGARDPLGGWLERGSDGRATGRVDEYALGPESRARSLARGDSVVLAAARREGIAAAAFGITTLQTMANTLTPAAARTIARAGALPVRHHVIRFPTTTDAGRSREWRLVGADTVLGPLTRVAGTKWVLDGTPIERLALTRAAYADRPGWHGRLDFPVDTLRAMLAEALTSGDQLILHAVGDSTIAIVLSLMQSLAPDSVWRPLRLRLEHADGIGRDQLDAVRRLGIVVVQNPAHLAFPDVLRARWGDARLRDAQLLRSLVDARVPLALGSDGPLNPFLNLMFATTHPANPAEALTREQAVFAYTLGSAYAERAEREKGSLTVGKLADLAVLSQDVFGVPAAALPATTSVLTVVNGRVVHDALGAGSRR